MRRLGLDLTGSVFLKPGDFWFGAAPAVVRTILGSCIAITVWHPQHRIGGMCHYLLPDVELRQPRHGQGRTAGEALVLFLDAIRRHGTQPAGYQVKLFGGASFFSPDASMPADSSHGITQVAHRNIHSARQLLEQHGFTILRESVGGQTSRRLVFDLESGDTWLNLSGKP